MSEHRQNLPQRGKVHYQKHCLKGTYVHPWPTGTQPKRWIVAERSPDGTGWRWPTDRPYYLATGEAWVVRPNLTDCPSSSCFEQAYMWAYNWFIRPERKRPA